MSHRIRCYTLFDITQTNIPNRANPPEDTNYTEWLKKRNQQCNFDTILQVISMRSQPDVVKSPCMTEINLSTINYFGNNYVDNHQVWHFEFDIHHSSVFDDGINIFGFLYNDCIGVPMIQTDNNLTTFLDTSIERKNIHFEKL